MTDKKRKIIGNTLVFALIFAALALYCRPVPLSTLGGWTDDPDIYADLYYEAYHTNAQGKLAADVYAAASANGEWSDLLASIRVCRMPFNWLGNLLPGTGAHQLADGMTDWNLHAHDQSAENSMVGLQAYGEGQFCYTTPRLNQYLPCAVKDADELQQKIDALIEQYGKPIKSNKGADTP